MEPIVDHSTPAAHPGRRTSRAMHLLIALGAVIAVATGCSGPCAGDGGSSCTPDGGPLVIRRDDALTVRPVDPSGGVTIALDTRLCFQLALLHADGTSEVVTPGSATASLEVHDTTLVAAASADECGVAGVVGVAGGTTTVHVTLAGSGGSVSATVGISVLSVEPGALFGGAELLVGEEQPVLLAMSDPSGGMLSRLTPGTRLVDRLVDFHVDDPTIAAVDPPGSGMGLRLRGLTPGTAHVTGSYGATGRATPIRSEGDVTVLQPGQLVSISQIFLDLDGAQYAPYGSQALPPDVCLTPSLTGTFMNAMGITYSHTIDGAIFTTSSGAATITQGPPVQLCTHDVRGDIAVRGCAAAQCITGNYVIYGDGELASIAASPTSVTLDGRLPTAPTGAPYLQACLPVRVTLALATGAMRDVTDSPSLQWNLAPPDMPGTTMDIGDLKRALGADGAPLDDGSGNPCVVLATTSFTAMSVTALLSLRYGSVVATVPLALTAIR